MILGATLYQPLAPFPRCQEPGPSGGGSDGARRFVRHGFGVFPSRTCLEECYVNGLFWFS